MISKLKVLGILFILEEIQSLQENNITSSLDELKTKFGCIPIEAWNIMRLRNYAVEVVCWTNNYEVGNEPNEITMNHITISIKHNNIIEIDEKKKTITMEIELIFVWQDERIRAIFPENHGLIRFSPVTTERKPTFWDPFTTLEIEKQKKRRYILDPIIFQMGLMGSETVNGYLSWYNSTKSFTPGLASLVWSSIEWEVTVSCPFDYADFPFDAHECLLKMKLPFRWNLTVYNKPKSAVKYDLDGFEIESYHIDPYNRYKVLNKEHRTYFGFVVHARRQISTYVYQYYLPTITIVIAASLSFVIPLSAIPGRVSLIVTLFLTLTNIFIHHMVRALNLHML